VVACFRAFLISLFVIAAAFAVEPEDQLADPALEARARAISKELRCMVCQAQSVDDSPAPVAKALRQLVRERVVAGDSDAAVIDAVRARYGDEVLLKPRFDAANAALWLGPFLLLLIGCFVAVRFIRAHAPQPEAKELTADERAALEKMMDGKS
jgi:cytochrome c-type biogenesis protein CcmH